MVAVPVPVSSVPAAAARATVSDRMATYPLALLAVVAAACIAFVVEHLVAAPSLALIFVLPVLAVALTGGWGPSLFAAVISVLTFDFLFVTPRHSLRVESPSDLWALSLLVAVAAVASVVAEQSRRAQGPPAAPPNARKPSASSRGWPPARRRSNYGRRPAPRPSRTPSAPRPPSWRRTAARCESWPAPGAPPCPRPTSTRPAGRSPTVRRPMAASTRSTGPPSRFGRRPAPISSWRSTAAIVAHGRKIRRSISSSPRPC